jgi:DNA-binding MarR family transcriptional regulator
VTLPPPSQAKPQSGGAASQAATFRDLPVEAHIAWAGFLKAYKVVVQTVDKLTLAAADISLAEFELMLRIDDAEGRIRFIDLARQTLLSESRVSRRIDALAAKGYVERERSGDDGRATYAVLTPLGKAAFANAQRPLVDALEEHFLGVITPGKLREFGDLMIALSGGLSRNPAIRKAE